MSEHHVGTHRSPGNGLAPTLSPSATPLPRLGCGGPSQMNDDQSTGTPQVGLCIDDTSKPAISPHQQEHDVKIDPGPSTMTEA
jgi:hypothetical protein